MTKQQWEQREEARGIARQYQMAGWLAAVVRKRDRYIVRAVKSGERVKRARRPVSA